MRITFINKRCYLVETETVPILLQAGASLRAVRKLSDVKHCFITNDIYRTNRYAEQYTDMTVRKEMSNLRKIKDSVVNCGLNHVVIADKQDMLLFVENRNTLPNYKGVTILMVECAYSDLDVGDISQPHYTNLGKKMGLGDLLRDLKTFDKSSLRQIILFNTGKNINTKRAVREIFNFTGIETIVGGSSE